MSSLPLTNKLNPSMYNPPNYTRPTEGDKITEVQVKVNEIRSSLKQGIDKAIERGEKLEEIEEKALSLEENSIKFHRGSRSLKCLFCKQNARLIACFLFILAIVIFIIVMISQSYKNN